MAVQVTGTAWPVARKLTFRVMSWDGGSLPQVHRRRAQLCIRFAHESSLSPGYRVENRTGVPVTIFQDPATVTFKSGACAARRLRAAPRDS